MRLGGGGGGINSFALFRFVTWSFFGCSCGFESGILVFVVYCIVGRK